MSSPDPWRVGWWAKRRSWHCERVSETTSGDGPADWLTLPEVAARLGVRESKVHQMVRDGALLAVRREGARKVPIELVENPNVLKHLPGVLTLLRDAGYDDDEALGWLYEADDTLPGTPVRGLAGPLATEVKRRAQALGF